MRGNYRLSERDPLAIVGIGCRFPGQVSTPQQFWELLMHETDAVEEIPPERWDVRDFYHPDPTQPGKMYARHGAFLDRIDLFDAAFFGLAPAEASSLDPQQRLLMEASWEALEDAGIVPQQLAGSDTGVFIGICTNEYGILQNPETTNAYTNLGNAASIAANRLSFIFDVHGPSLSVDTACSSSLVAVHLACESLWRGDCSQALVGGVSLILSPGTSIGFSKAQMLAPRGRCRTFDAEAEGYVRGEGAGVVVLKPLAQARAAHDPVYAVIRGCGINQDGHTRVLPYPSREAQKQLLRHVYAEAGVDPAQVYYVEAHGTGTLGDLVEAHALGTVLGCNRPEGQWLRVGSVKTNIGHLEGASGMAGLIKTALLLKQRRLPASLHFHTPHPNIPFERLRLKVQATTEEILQEGPVCAGINSFGFGGTNAHVILQEYLAPMEQQNGTATLPSAAPYLLPLSARSPEALRTLVQSYIKLLRSEHAPVLRDICFTASKRREQHPFRLALKVNTAAELAGKLEAFLAHEQGSGVTAGLAQPAKKPKLAFVFAGNGPQWWAMGRQLLTEQPLFREMVMRCDRLLSPYTGWSLLEELLADESASRMQRTEVAQPALFALQLGLVALWKSWGIEPGAVIGHSVGEVAAAYTAGVLNLEDAIRVVFQRSRLQELTAGTGRMLAADISVEKALELLRPYEGRLTLAVVNSPQSVTLAGDVEALEQLMVQLDEQDTFYRLLDLNYAFHCATLDPIKEELLRSLHALQAQPAAIPFVSTVTGTDLAGPECDAGYWWRNVREPVQFAAGIQNLIAVGNTVFLEVGPHPVLSAYIHDNLLKWSEKEGDLNTRSRPADPQSRVYQGNPTTSPDFARDAQRVYTLCSLRRREDEMATLLQTLGALYTLGAPLCWDELVRGGKHVPLPLYPWQRERYWNLPSRAPAAHPLLGRRQEQLPPVAWKSSLNMPHLLYLQDHRVGGTALFPTTGYLEALLAVAQELYGKGSCMVEQFRILRPLFIGETQSCMLHIQLAPEERSVQIYSRPLGEQAQWTQYVTAQIGKLQQEPVIPLTPAEMRLRCPQEISISAMYHESRLHSQEYGPAFQLLTYLGVGELEAYSVIVPTEHVQLEAEEYCWHPAVLDSCLQTAMPLLSCEEELHLVARQQRSSYLPIGVDCVRFYVRPQTTRQIYTHVRVIRRGRHYFKADYAVVDETGQLLLEMVGVSFHVVDTALFSLMSGGQSRWQDLFYEEVWLPALEGRLPALEGRLPSPAHFLAQLRPQLEQVLQEASLARWHEVQPHLDRLSLAYVLAALRQLGLHLEAGERVSVAVLQERLGILVCYERFLTVWCGLLTEYGLLQAVGAEWVVVRTPVDEDPRQLLRQLMLMYPAAHAEITLVARSGDQLAEVLTGISAPLSLASSEGDFAVFEHFYESGLGEQRCHLLLQEIVKQLVEHLPPGKVLRVLALDAGTGGTTSALLPLFAPEQVEYVFACSSEAALQQAQQRYSSYPFLRCQLIDLAQDAPFQGFEPDRFDIVLASHALSAVPHLRQVLHQLRLLLTSKGWLGCIETTTLSPFLALVFGQQVAYWAVQDSELRPLQPLVTEKQWRQLLAEAGFVDVAPAVDCHEWSQPDRTLFLAQGSETEEKPATAELPGSDTWVIFADEHGVAKALEERYAACAARIVIVRRGQEYQRLDDCHFELRSSEPEDLSLLLRAVQKDRGSIAGIQYVYLWGLCGVSEDWTSEILNACVSSGCLDLLLLLQEHTRVLEQVPTRLWIVTGGAQVLVGEGAQLALAQAPLYGLGRTLLNEHPELRCTLVDIGTPDMWDGRLCYAVDALAAELLAQTDEPEVLLRGAGRFINRVRRVEDERLMRADKLVALPESSYQLEAPLREKLDGLAFHAGTRQQPGPGEVEIAISMVGLNFRDIILAMRIVPSGILEESFGQYTLGWEGAGRISALGAGVEHLRVGDEVLTVGSPSFCPFVLRDARLVYRKPAHLTLEEAATIPTVFMTAYYGLHYLARMRKGERVLIHGAAGGVGLAAIQMVQHMEGEIFATAGTPEKRAYLRALGVQHVLDSRSLTFADEIMRLTAGAGVDIVLNSLAGEAMEKSIAVLRPLGRFVEMGKRDFLEQKRLRLAPFQRSLSYFAIDVSILSQEDIALSRQLVEEILELFEKRVYTPLPYRLFQAHQVIEAFRYMQQSRHIGKVVVSLQRSYAHVKHHEPVKPFVIRSDGSYLITGGLSGFGLATARWLVQHGARHLALVSRSGARSVEADQVIAELEHQGVQVFIAAVDVTQEKQVAVLFHQLREALPPLRGVIHAAMILNDRPIEQMDEASFLSVLRPKMLGAWHLHAHTLGLSLDFFLLYSSISALIGNMFQANYVAGNLFLDALAQYRQALGLPAMAVRWGALGDVGYVARHADTRQMLWHTGVEALSSAQALQALERCLQDGRPLAHVASLDWKKLGSAGLSTRVSSRWAGLLVQGEVGVESGRSADFSTLFVQAGPEERQELVLTHVLQLVARVTGTAVAGMKGEQSLSELAVDSLAAMELRNALKQDLGIEPTMAQLLRSKSLAGFAAQLTNLLIEKLRCGQKESDETQATLQGVEAEVQISG